MKRKKRNNKGVTLIALVTTIVIMLILASVSVATLSGDNGLIEKAGWGAFSEEILQVREQIETKQIENMKTMDEEEALISIFTKYAEVQKLPKSLKMEILYVRENMPENKEPTKEYYIEDMLDYLVDESGTVKGLYYVPEGIGADGKTYIYDTLTDTVYRIKGISLRWKTVHSYKYGCIVMGDENKNVFEEEKYLFETESEPVTINGETYYAPNLEGFNGLTTQAAYYSQDDKQTLEVGISLHMNQQVINEIVDGKTTYTWYDYANKKWANIKTVANGQEAWWVWIPRYAYRLPENPNDDTEIIFIDTNNKPLDTAKYGNNLPLSFTIHPAFDQDTEGKLTGVWVSKYKPSKY